MSENLQLLEIDVPKHLQLFLDDAAGRMESEERRSSQETRDAVAYHYLMPSLTSLNSDETTDPSTVHRLPLNYQRQQKRSP